MKRLWRHYNLGIILAGLWIGFLFVYLGTQWAIHVHYGEANAPWILQWFDGVAENNQSEFLQLFAMVTLTSFLIFKGSPESRDSDDEMKAMLKQMQRQIDELTAAQSTDIRPQEIRRSA